MTSQSSTFDGDLNEGPHDKTFDFGQTHGN